MRALLFDMDAQVAMANATTSTLDVSVVARGLIQLHRRELVAAIETLAGVHEHSVNGGLM